MRLTAVAVAGMLCVSACSSTPLDEARTMLADDGRFDTATEASQTFGSIADVLLAASEACSPNVSCEGLRSATAYAVVLGTRVAVCTAPGRHDARQKLRTFLDEVEVLGPDDAAPDSPGLPDCR